MIPHEYRSIMFPENVEPGDTRRQRLLSMARKFKENVLGLLYPPHCLCCQCDLPLDGNGVICRKCAEKVKWIGVDYCRRCGDRVGEGSGIVEQCMECRKHPPVYISATCAVARYGEPLRSLILSFKFGRQLSAQKLLAELIARRMQKVLIEESATIDHLKDALLIPVPLYKVQAKSRGFNQTELLADGIAKSLKLRVCAGLLRKTTDTSPQATLNAAKRRENLKGAFTVDSSIHKKVQGSTLVLIDDVMTTGATLSECARTLHEAGFKRLFAGVVARG